MKTLRVAVCQLESHPALYASHVAYLEEPFVPTSNDVSLSALSAKGLDLSEVQAQCLQDYTTWQRTRISAVLRYLSQIEPVPDLVVFPEAAIPLHVLPDISAWSKSHGVAVLAGTHTLQSDATARRVYKSIGVEANRIKKLVAEAPVSVLPLFRSGRLTLIPKKTLSPFERAVVSTPQVTEPFTPHPIASGTYLLPLICSEALNDVVTRRSYDLIAILSYDDKPAQFASYIAQQVRNRRFVVHCNDGRHGGSAIFAVDDERFPNWLRTTLPNGLPPGDHLIVADINLRATTVQVATASPDQAVQLVRLASVVPSSAATALTSRVLLEGTQLQDSAKRTEALEPLNSESRSDSLQLIRIRQLLDLERRGLPSAPWWSVLGVDCVVESIPALRDLEAHLSALAAHRLNELFSSPVATRADVAPSLVKTLSSLRSRSSTDVPSLHSSPAVTQRSVIDRDAELRTILRFLDDRAATVLQIVGLPQIGKSAVVEKAFAQSGIRTHVRIPLSATASVDYVLYSLIGATTAGPPYADPTAVARGADARGALKRAGLVLIERADYLCPHEVWNDERWPAMFAAIVESAKSVGARLLIETRRELPFDISTQTEVQRQRISGLDRNLVEYGIELFDAQLRRVNLSPNAFSYDDKRTVVMKLGGHPLGIALAADIAYVDGIGAVIDALRNKKGFFLTFIADVIKDLSLSDQEIIILKLCGLARSGAPREALLAAAGFPASAAIRNLLQIAALDYTEDGLISVASLLREQFDPSELPPDMIARFHREAAQHLSSLSRKGPIAIAVEAEYHGRLAGIQQQLTPGLTDSALAAAETLYEQQHYDAALAAIQHFLDVNPTTEILRLATLIEARRNHFDAALRYAEQAFSRNRRDTWLLSELAKIALTEFQHFGVADRLVAIARKAGVEDVSILIVEGRLHLRRSQLASAASTFARACELTETNPWPYYYLGTTHMRLGDLDAAVDVLHSGEEFFYAREARSRKALSAIQTQLSIAYIFMDRVDLAEPIVRAQLQRNPENPEVIRAFAALTIKKDGITEAHRALEELRKAKIKTNADRCQFHLIYGLFYLGINDLHRASEEFAKASSADRSNVYVMIRWARTLFELGKARWLDGDDSHRTYLEDCARLVRKILEFDVNNREATNLVVALHSRFEIEV